MNPSKHSLTVLAQLFKLIPRNLIPKLANEYGVEEQSRSFTATSHVLALMYAQLAYDREVPDTFNMCLDYPEKLSIVLPCSLANDYPPEAAIRGDEGTLTLQNPGEWNAGFDSITIVPPKGESRVYPAGKLDPTPKHWQNFLSCVRSREKPVSDVEFGLHVQAALNMAMLSLLKEKVAKFDFQKQRIVL